LGNSNGNKKPTHRSSHYFGNPIGRLIRYGIRKFRQRHADKKKESSQDKASRRTANATIAIAILTITLAISSGFQVWAFILSERGIVATSRIALIPTDHPIPGQIVAFDIVIKNGGNSLVHVVLGRAEMANPNMPLPDTPFFDGSEQPWQTILLPGDSAALTSIPQFQGKKFEFGADNIDALNRGKMNIWIYGYIIYRDRFSTLLGPTTIGYCYHYNPTNTTSDPNFGMFDACGSSSYVYIH
jgi:hypothetical protein